MAGALARLRARSQRLLRRALERVGPGTVVTTEYDMSTAARYGWDGRPAHKALDALFASGREGYAALLDSWRSHLPALRSIGRRPSGPTPGWENDYFSGLDAVALHGLFATQRPARYVEVGSGHSTTFARRAIDDLRLTTRVVSIDPAPRADIDRLCDEVHRHRLEDVGPEPFAALAPGDIAFIDGSHHAFMGSDGVVEFLEVLPGIASGVVVGIDDVFLPWDYHPTWIERRYSEQYVLGALLLAPDSGWDVLFPAWWVSNDPALANRVASFDNPARTRFGLSGVTIWLRKR